jgi:hypothetical protein
MTDDLIARLDAAIGGPDRRRKDGARVRKMTPLKIEVQLLLDAKAEIQRLRNELAGSERMRRVREALDSA